MKKVTGIGGFFFKCEDPQAINDWYKLHLGFETTPYGTSFKWIDKDSDTDGITQWNPFPADTDYFNPSQKSFMINYRVEDLVSLVGQLKKSGINILDEIESYSYGKFVHIMDPEGNKIQLWEPSN